MNPPPPSSPSPPPPPSPSRSTPSSTSSPADPAAAALPRLYADLAWLWPILSPPEQYAAEAQLLEELITRRLGPGPHRILELGAGGGHTLVHLDHRGHGRHDTVAVDLSAPMLAHARRLIPGLETHVADMRDLRLGQSFDLVLIHDAIDYLDKPGDVARALATAHAHLRPGGLTVVAPTYTTETFIDGESTHDFAEAYPDLDLEIDPAASGQTESQSDGPSTAGAAPPTADFVGEVTYLSYVHDPDPADHAFEMILLYLIRAETGDDAPRAVRVVEDRHRCGLFDRMTWLDLIQTAGLDAEFLQQGDDDEDGAWSLFVGTRRD